MTLISLMTATGISGCCFDDGYQASAPIIVERHVAWYCFMEVAVVSGSYIILAY